MLRLACPSRTDHDTHTHTHAHMHTGPVPLRSSLWSLSVRARTHRSVSSVASFSWERMAAAPCVAPWLTLCLFVMCRRPIDTWAWAAFSVLVQCWVSTLIFPLPLHISGLSCHPVPLLLCVVTRRSFLSRSEPKVHPLSFCCFRYAHSLLPVLIWTNVSAVFFPPLCWFVVG